MKMGGPTIPEGQTFCLKWNNHKSNLVEILDTLIKLESYVDVTIVVDENVQFKAHRVVLAASSPYFQSILQDVPMDHCSILFPGVQEFEMRALLEYMYTGEVNVTQSQIPKIMRIASQLEVKGLFDMADLKEKFINDASSPTATPSSSNNSEPQPPKTPTSYSSNHSTSSSSPQITTTSTNITSAAQSSSASPPYNSFKPTSSTFSTSQHKSNGPMEHSPSWPLSPFNASALSSVYDAPDMNPLKRKKLSSLSSMLNRDTPILRNVLAQPQSADSSQPAMPQSALSMSIKEEINGEKVQNGMNYNGEYEKMKKFEEAHSPFTDRSFEDEQIDNFNNSDNRHNMNNSFNSANQKPEWKRYKQYTRNDILNAIECVKNGMSALQAARKFGVPSRTLYDKVKKMGISSGCQRNRTIKRPSSNNGSPASFPYGISGFPGSEQMARSLHNPANLLDPALIKKALEHRGGDAMHVMAFAAAAHAAANVMSTSPVLNGVPRTPSPNAAMKFGLPPSESYYSRESQIIKRERDADFEDGGVEDLSVSRKSPSPRNSPSPQQLTISQKSSVIVSTKLDEEMNGVSMKREIMAEDS
ncbi:hypothetical protein ACFFRR_008274 [Megaselia abdita]